MAGRNSLMRFQPNVWYEKPNSRRSSDVGMPSNRYGLPSRSSLESLGIRMENPEVLDSYGRGGPYPPGDSYTNQPYGNVADHYRNPPTRYILNVNRYGNQDSSHQNLVGCAGPYSQPNYNDPGFNSHPSVVQIQRNVEERYNHPADGQEAFITETLVRKVVVPSINTRRSFDNSVPQHLNHYGFEGSSFNHRTGFSQGNAGERYRIGDQGSDLRLNSILHNAIGYRRTGPYHLEPERHVEGRIGGHIGGPNLGRSYRSDGSAIHPLLPDNSTGQVQFNQNLHCNEPVNDITNNGKTSVVNESSVVRSVHRGEGNVETTMNQFYSSRYKVGGPGFSGAMPMPNRLCNENSLIHSSLSSGCAYQIRQGQYITESVAGYPMNLDSNASGRIHERNSQVRPHQQFPRMGEPFDTGNYDAAAISNGGGMNSDSIRSCYQITRPYNGDVECRLPFISDAVQNNHIFDANKPSKQPSTNSRREVHNQRRTEPIGNAIQSRKGSYGVRNSLSISNTRQSGQSLDNSASNMSNNAAEQVSANQRGSSAAERYPQSLDLPKDQRLRDGIHLVEVFLGSEDVMVTSEFGDVSKHSYEQEKNTASHQIQENSSAGNVTGHFYEMYPSGPYVMMDGGGFITSGSELQLRAGLENMSINQPQDNYPGNYELQQLDYGQSVKHVAGNKRSKNPAKKWAHKTKDLGVLKKNQKSPKPRKRPQKNIPLMSQDAEDIVVEVDLPSYLNMFSKNGDPVDDKEEVKEDDEAEIVEVDPESLNIQHYEESKSVPVIVGGELLRKCLTVSSAEELAQQPNVEMNGPKKMSTSSKGLDPRYSHLIKPCYVSLERFDSKLNTTQRSVAYRTSLINELMSNARSQLRCKLSNKDSDETSSSRRVSSAEGEEMGTKSIGNDECQSPECNKSMHNSASKPSEGAAVVGEEEPEEDIADVTPDRVGGDVESTLCIPVAKNSISPDNRVEKRVGNGPSSTHKHPTKLVVKHHKKKGSKKLLRLFAFWETPSEKHFKSARSVTTVSCPLSPPRSSSSSPVCSVTPTSRLERLSYSEHTATSVQSPPCTPERCGSGTPSALALLKGVKLTLVKCDSIVKRMSPKSNETQENIVDASRWRGVTPVKSAADQVSAVRRKLSLKMLQPVVLLDKLDDKKSSNLSGPSEHRTKYSSVSSVDSCTSPNCNSTNNKVVTSPNSPNQLKRCFVVLQRIDSHIRWPGDAKRRRLSSIS